MPATLTPSINSTNVRNLSWTTFRAAMRVVSTLIPRTVEEWAVNRFLTPQRYPHPAAELELLARGERFAVPLDVRKIAAWSFGPKDAPVVVCSHGWSGRGAQFLHFVDPLLAEGFRVVLFDHPGHGFTGGSTSSLMEFAAATQQVLNFLYSRNADVHGIIGHSLGGPAAAIALRQSFNHPRRVVLIAPPSSLTEYSRRFARFLGLSERVRRGVQRRIERRYAVAWSTLELPDSVAGMRVPALVIHDRDDREVRVANGAAIARHWPDARLVVTQGLGHRAIMKDPQVVCDAIDFLQGRVEFSRSAPDDIRHAAPAPLF